MILLLAYAWAIHPNLPKRDIAPLMGVDYAHRGYWTTNDPGEENRPENSLAGFRAAVEHGYGIELDVHRTRDGALVVHHDDSLKRLTGVDIRIARSTLKEVRACKLPNGEPVPTFDEVLKAVNSIVQTTFADRSLCIAVLLGHVLVGIILTYIGVRRTRWE